MPPLSLTTDGASLLKLQCSVTVRVSPVLSVAVTCGCTRWYVSVHCTLRNHLALATLVGPSGYTLSRNDSALYVAMDTLYSML